MDEETVLRPYHIKQLLAYLAHTEEITTATQDFVLTKGEYASLKKLMDK